MCFLCVAAVLNYLRPWRLKVEQDHSYAVFDVEITSCRLLQTTPSLAFMMDAPHSSLRWNLTSLPAGWSPSASNICPVWQRPPAPPGSVFKLHLPCFPLSDLLTLRWSCLYSPVRLWGPLWSPCLNITWNISAITNSAWIIFEMQNLFQLLYNENRNFRINSYLAKLQLLCN